MESYDDDHTDVDYMSDYIGGNDEEEAKDNFD